MIYQYALFIPSNKIEDARSLISAMFGCSMADTGYYMSSPFTSDGANISYYGGAAYISEDQLVAARAHLHPWAKFFRWDVDTNELLATSEAATIGTEWSAVQSAIYLGLTPLT